MNHILRTTRVLLRACAAPSLLALFVLALYARLLFTDRVLASGDIFLYFYPYRDYASAILRTGQIPLWNPYIFLGVPFLANPQAAVLYPLHWPLLWLTPTQQIYWSAALHTWLLGLGAYFLLRRWQLSAGASLIGGLVLAGSGFYGGLIGHLNQMNGAAWLPWLVLVIERSDWQLAIGEREDQSLIANRQSLLTAILCFAILTALMLLAGHTQTTYINLVGVGAWAIWPRLTVWQQGTWRARLAAWAAVWPRLLVMGVGVGVGVLLSAAQLLPTLELSNLGLRSGGLTYNMVSSFSLKPLRLPFTLLPTYGLVDLGVVFATEGYTEYVAYVGLFGLLLALLGGWKGRGRARTFGLLFVGLGLLLALGRWNPLYFVLYKIVPGFNLFRTPARWLMLYTMGMAVLAGLGVDCLVGKIQGLGTRDGRWAIRLSSLIVNLQSLVARHPQLSSLCLALLVAADLFLAARALPYTQPTAPQAVYDVRTAPAHLLTDPARATLGPAAMGRFLSMSTTRFDPGDAADFHRIFREEPPVQMDERAFAQLIIALKAQEILAPNLPLLWRVPAVDGYDGGVLPLQRYIQALTLFVPPDRLVPDGRLSEQIKTVPSAALLGLLNVQYVITDKVRDLWFDNVYYDRQIGAQLRPGGPALVQIAVPHPLEATHIGLIGAITGDAQALQQLQHQKISIAKVIVQQDHTNVQRFTLTAGGEKGADWADDALDSPRAASSGAVVAYQDVDGKHQEYQARFTLPQPSTPVSITIQRLATPFTVTVQAASLIDARTGMFTPLLPSDRGRFQLVHSGDVKIYENLDVRPRAYLAYQILSAPTAQAALNLLESGQVMTNTSAVVEGLPGFTTQPAATDQVNILHYAPEQVDIQTRSQAQALLVLSDSAYPGWTATVDQTPTPIYTTNYLMRGVRVPPGEHLVRFRYQPASWQRGLWLSATGFILCILLFIGAFTRRPQG